MAKAADSVVGVANPDGGGLASLVREAFRARIGAERFAVWFGDAAAFVVDSTAGSLTVTTMAGFQQDWLRKTFQADLEAASIEAAGRRLAVVWQAAESAPAASAESQEPVRPTGPTRRTARPATAEPPRPVVAPLPRRPACDLADFVVGASNRMAFGAIEIVASRPGEMSPLVIHGPTGVGKTHLLEGICGRVRQSHPGINVVSLSAEQFTTGFLQALHGGGLPGFRRSCRSADLLVVDDLQFLVGKRATLVEFQHTVDTLHRQGRQMVFACDRELDALAGLGGDLLTRLRGGMTARLLPPDYEVRRGIVERVCGQRGLSVPADVAHFVATRMTRHARELLGAVNRLEAASLMLGIPIAAGMAEEALADLVRSSGRAVRLGDVEQAVCKAFGIDPAGMHSPKRSKAASHPRMLAMFLARRHTGAALAEIGSHFGRRSHSTVIAAQKAVEEWVAKGERIVLGEVPWDAAEAIRRVEDILRAG
jgi:chromosomal replication initiator protein